LGALTAAGQLLIVGTLPSYSRVFDPGTYGEYVIFVGAFTVVSVFAGMRYDSAIVLPRSEGLAAALSAVVITIGMAVAALIAMFTVLAVTRAPGLMPGRWAHGEGHFGYGLAAATALGTLQRCLTAWCIRRGRFLVMGWGQFLLALVTVGAQLSLAHLAGGLAALIWGLVCAMGVQAGCLAIFTLDSRDLRWTRAASLRGMRVAARRYRRFPAYMVGYALASSVRDRLVQVALGIGAGAAVVGRFGLAYRVMFAPNSLVYSAVSPVFFGIASRGSRPAVGRFAAGLVEAAFVALVVPYVAFAIEAPSLTDGLLSHKWQGTGPYLQALAGPALVLATTCWLDRAFDSFNRQRVAFSLEASFTLVSVLAVGVSSRLLGAVSTVWVFGLLAFAYYWIYFLSTFVACGFPLSDFRRACVTAGFSLGITLILSALIHPITDLALRLAMYTLLLAAVTGGWIRFRGGADILRALVQSRVNGSGGAGY